MTFVLLTDEYHVSWEGNLGVHSYEKWDSTPGDLQQTVSCHFETLLVILKCHDNLQLNLPLTNASSVGVEGGKRTLRFLRLYPCIRNWKSSSAFCMVSFKSVHMSFFLQFYAVILLFSLCSIDSIWCKCWKCIYLFLFKKKKKKRLW